MRATSVVGSLFLLALYAPAQVVAPEEIRDPSVRDLQKKYWGELKQVSAALAKHDFPYRFYFSRTLDLSEKEQQQRDQRSIQFDRYRDQTVVKITGNYFASYSTELMQPAERARQTYQEVILPLLEAAVPAFATSIVPDAFAFEISHHVRKKILGVSSEGVENVVLILPKASALRAMTAANVQAKQAAVAEGETFLNAAPIQLWPGLETRPTQAGPASPPPSMPSRGPVVAAADIVPGSGSTPEATRGTSPDALKEIQASYQASLDRMGQDLNAQAHFVRYAPPAFIVFHKGLYLQLSVTTTLLQSPAGSQYRLAALAFDQHIAHLIRPTLAFFKEDPGDFDGIDISTSVRLGGDKDSEGSPIAVEFIFPLSSLKAYKQFDVTGQQLIDSGFVLINGERVSLNLQIAEDGVLSR